MNDKKQGISLIALIITIIVVIIITAITIYSSFDVVDKATLAKFKSEFADFRTLIQHEFLDLKKDKALSSNSLSNKDIYQAMCKIDDVDEDIKDMAMLKETYGDATNILEGVEFYELKDSPEILEWKRNKKYVVGEAKIYITNEGDVFTLPGFKVDGDNEATFYLNEKAYYTLAKGESIDMPKLPPLYISSGEAKILGSINIGDYVDYAPTENEYALNEAPQNKNASDYYLGHDDVDSISTDKNIKWRIIKICETGEVLITPENAVNSLKLEGMPAYQNFSRILDFISYKLYSSRKLKVAARAMIPEDLGCEVKIDNGKTTVRGGNADAISKIGSSWGYINTSIADAIFYKVGIKRSTGVLYYADISDQNGDAPYGPLYYGLRPVVPLGKNICIDAQDASRDGSSSKPWKLSKIK